MGWRKNTRAIIRAYPELKLRERELEEVAVTPRYSAEPGSSEASRTTEAVALRSLPPGDQRALDAVSNAIQTTMRYRNGDLRVRIIDLVYWKQTHTLEGAALAVHVSPQTAQEWNSAFIELVDAYMRVL